ncbi:hypothetical protein CTJ11_12945, partial [Staphylococcus epidermidis]
ASYAGLAGARRRRRDPGRQCACAVALTVAQRAGRRRKMLPSPRQTIRRRFHAGKLDQHIRTDAEPGADAAQGLRGVQARRSRQDRAALHRVARTRARRFRHVASAGHGQFPAPPAGGGAALARRRAEGQFGFVGGNVESRAGAAHRRTV